MAARRPSILPFLPILSASDSGSLSWPEELLHALKVITLGPSKSRIYSSQDLCDLIQDLRAQSRLPSLSEDFFDGITAYFDDHIKRVDAQEFFESVLPRMGDLALRLPDLLNHHFCMAPVIGDNPIFKQVTLRILYPQQAGIVFLSQELVASILVCAFFCIYPLDGRKDAELPYFNFDKLFCNMTSQQENKVHCIMNYFSRVCHSMPDGVVSYERKVLPQHEGCEIFSPVSEPDRKFWRDSKTILCPLKAYKNGMIEDHNAKALEVDFANRSLGGGVLFRGCVQEEIRFVISPELIAGMLFISMIDDNEAIEIRGTERFSKHDGYASSFKFIGNYVDLKPRDWLGRKETYIVAIDALMDPGRHQFKEAQILRETNKAFCGFLDHAEKHLIESFETHEILEESNKISLLSSTSTVESELQASSTIEHHDILTKRVPGIATGNWGCGAFGGDVELKSLLQWIAASQTGRPILCYYTFGDHCLQNLQELADWIRKEKWSVGELWDVLIDYGEKRFRGECKEGIFTWILPCLSTNAK